MSQPLVEFDGINQSDIDKANELLAPEQKERSPTPSSEIYEEDKQSLQPESIQDVEEQVNSDDNSEYNTNIDDQQPEYSKTDKNPSTPSIDNKDVDNIHKFDIKQQEKPEDNDDDEREEEKEAETEQHEVHQNNNNQIIENKSTDNHKEEEQEEKEKEKAIDSKYALPSTLNAIPIESTVTMDDSDKIIAKQMREKYADKLSKYPLDKMQFVERYTVGYKHIKKKKRMSEMCKDIDYFFEMHDKYDFDNIIQTESTPQELDAWKQFLYGQDAEGHPVMYDLIGSSDCDKMKKVFMDKDEPFGQAAYQHVFRFMRKVENCKIQNSKKYGKKIYKQIQIMDMKGFTSDHLKGKNRKMTKMMIESLTRMFPEGTYKMFIINAPWPFRALWGTVKAFLDAVTVKKTKVLGEDYLKELVKHIPIEMIPPCYGGKGVWEIQYGSVPKNYSIDVYHGLD